MSRHILVTPIGRSPGAVTGAYLALSSRAGMGYDIDEVVTIGTGDLLVQQAQQFVDDVFKLNDERICAKHTPMNIDAAELDEESSFAYLEMWKKVLRGAREAQQPPRVSICLTPGYAGMSGLAVLATNFYGADELLHFWIPEEITKISAINHPQHPRLADLDVVQINPFAADDPQWEMVPLSFTSLDALYPIIREYIESEKKTYPAIDTVWYHLSKLANYNELIAEFERLPPKAVEELILLAPGNFAALYRERQLEIELSFDRIMRHYHITDEALRDSLWQAVKSARSGEQLRTTLPDKLDKPYNGAAKKVLYDVFVSTIANVLASGSMTLAGF